MKYMILAYGSQQDYDSLAEKDGAQPAASAEELAAIGEFLTKFTGDLAASGELVDTQGLTAPVLARRVQLRDGCRSSPTARSPRLRRSSPATIHTEGECAALAV